MQSEMLQKIEDAICKMADQVKAQTDGSKILHCSQAALNLAHAWAIVDGIKSGANTGKPAAAAKKSD